MFMVSLKKCWYIFLHSSLLNPVMQFTSPDPDMCSLGNTPLLLHPAPSLPLYDVLRDFQLSIASYQCDCEITVFLSVISECF